MREMTAARKPFSLGRFFVALLLFALVVGGLPLGTGWWLGRHAAEKLLTQLCMPVGLVWMALLLMTLISWASRRRGTAIMLALLFAFDWAMSCSYLSQQAIQALEGQVVSWDPTRDDKLDVLVVLGGGTNRDEQRRSQLTGAGDRVAWSARLFQRGKASKLVTTGDAIASLSEAGDDPSEETIEIWLDWGIDKTYIETLSGRNTAEELADLRSRTDLWQGKRVGLVTSAFHMPRAMRLAKGLGLDLIPVSCDRKSSSGPMTAMDFLPSAGAMRDWETVWKETLANFVGR